MWVVVVQRQFKDYAHEFEDEYLARSFYDACVADQRDNGSWEDERMYLARVERFTSLKANLVACTVCKGKGCLPPDEGGSVCTDCGGTGAERNDR